MPDPDPPEDCPSCFDNGWVWDATVKPAVKVGCPDGCKMPSRKGK